MRLQKFKKIWLGLFLCVLMLAIGLFAFVRTLSDIRPERLKQGISAEDKKAGKKLLHEMEEAYGGFAKWKAQKRFSFVQSSNWYGFPNTLIKGWDVNPQLFQLDGIPGATKGELLLLAGPNRGKRWRLHNDKMLQVNKDGSLGVKNDATLRYKYIYKNYWFQFPFRVREALVIAYGGETLVKGQKYKLLYATWGDGTPNAKWDQFLLYIHPKTKFIDWLRFTVREGAAFMDIHARFSDFRKSGGLTMPYKQEVRRGRPGEEGYRLHENVYSSVKWFTK